MKRLVLASAAVALFGWVNPVQATPITSDTIQIRMADGTTLLDSGGIAEGPGSPCTVGGVPGTPITFQCENTSISAGFTYLANTSPADVGIFLTELDGSVSDFVLVDFPTCCNSVGMNIYSDVDGSLFPTAAQFQAALPFLRMTSIPETGAFQNVTGVALGLIVNNSSLVNQITPNFTFWVQSDASEPVPEPASLLLLGTGLAAVARRRFKQRS